MTWAAEKTYLQRSADLLEGADEIEVFAIDPKRAGEDSDAWQSQEIRLDETYWINQRITLKGDAKLPLLHSLQGMLRKAVPKSVLCHEPGFAVRIWKVGPTEEDRKLMFESTLCWRCWNYLAPGLRGETQLAITDHNLLDIFQKLLPPLEAPQVQGPPAPAAPPKSPEVETPGLSQFIPHAFAPMTIGSGVEVEITYRYPDQKWARETFRQTVTDEYEALHKNYLVTELDWPGDRFRSERNMMRADGTGSYSLPFSSVTKGESLDLPHEVKLGATWKQQLAHGTLEREIVGVGDLKVDDRVYKGCAHVIGKMPGTSYTEEYWSSPEVGYLQSRVEMGNGTGYTADVKSRFAEPNLGKPQE